MRHKGLFDGDYCRGRDPKCKKKFCEEPKEVNPKDACSIRRTLQCNKLPGPSINRPSSSMRDGKFRPGSQMKHCVDQKSPSQSNGPHPCDNNKL